MESRPPTRRAQVDAAEAGTRLDVWLARRDDELSRSRVQKLLSEGLVRLDGELCPARQRVRGGQWVTWEVPAAEETSLDPDASVAFDLIYEDDHLAVVDKPAGLVVHPAVGHHSGTLIHGLLARLDSLSGVGGRARPGLVHRLDKDTSGLLVVAKNDPAHASLARQIQDRTLRREYRALCWGIPEPREGEIVAPLGRHPSQRKRQAVRKDGRFARTRYRVARDLEGAADLELALDTGRTHQIRVHLAYRGHPVVGDAVYGGGVGRLRGASPEHREGLQRALAILGRQALHACGLWLIHPRTGEELSFVSPLPDDHRRAQEALEGAHLP